MNELLTGDPPARRSQIVAGHLIVVAAAIGVPLAVTAVQASVRSKVPISYRFDTAWIELCLVVTLNLLCANLIGLPNLYRRFRTRLLATVAAPVLASSLAISILVLFKSTALPRSVFFVTPLLLAPCYLVATAVAHGSVFTRQRQILAVVGSAVELAAIETDLATLPRVDLRLIDSGDVETNPGRLVGLRPDVLVLCTSSRDSQAVIGEAAELHLSGTRVRRLVDFYEEWIGKLPIQELEITALFTDVAEIHAPIYLRAKRWIDVAAGLAMLIPLLGVGSVVWIANRFASPGPLIFAQERVGLNGQTFHIFKFRTMKPSEATAGAWTADNDPRITKIGSILRRTHLDELPQAVNILRGELSMVGPRPEQLHYVEELSEKVPFYQLRHAVRPGLTGWAQVRYPYGANERDAFEKLQFELYYIRHQRLSLDLQILVKTAHNMLTGAGK